MRSAQSIKEIRQAVRQKFAWPGGYPLYLVMKDGESICMACARKEWKQISFSTRAEYRNGWQAEAATVNWENSELCCAHCNGKIESAYGFDSEIEASE